MIDLHMHTKYSDGQFNVRELLNILNNKGIKYASITDHNSIDAHIEMRDDNLYSLYNGKMITGVEIQTLVDDYLIEVLAYNFDIDKLNKFIKDTRKNFWKFHENAYRELLKKANEMGLKYIEPDKELGGSYYCNTKFQEAIAACYDYNKDIVDEKILTDHLHFYRNEFQRVDSKFYIDNKKAFPNIDVVIKMVREAGGMIFIAHIDEYRIIPDKIAFLDDVFNRYDIDGIECFHPAIDDDNRKEYIDYCRNNNLLISAGSDFHGEHFSHRRNITTEATLNDIEWLEELK